jgi:DNA-binding response OmpR family regulator
VKKKILYVENRPDVQEVYTRLLQNAGYTVVTARSVDAAQRLLETEDVHLMLVDLRLEDDDDERDNSGLLLVEDERYRTIPKIILTAVAVGEQTVKVMTPPAAGLPAAVNYVKKDAGPQRLMTAVDEAFARHVRLNQDLVIYWEERGSLLQLVHLMDPQVAPAQLQRLAEELESLLRRVFADAAQITLSQCLLSNAGRMVLIVQKYPHTGRPVQIILTCGYHHHMQAEQENYERYAPKEGLIGITLRSQAPTHESRHFAMGRYTLIGNSSGKVAPFRSLYHTLDAHRLALLLEHLSNDVLRIWHGTGKHTIEGAQLMALCCTRARLAQEHLHALAEEGWLRQLAAESLREDLCRIEVTPEMLTLDFGEEPISLANPFPGLLQLQLAHDAPITCGIIHGQVDVDTLVGNEEGKAWLIDFAHAHEGPLWHDYVSLEMSLRLSLLEIPDLAPHYTLECLLLEYGFGADSLSTNPATPEMAKALRSLHQIRACAAVQGEGVAFQYQAALFFAVLAYLAQYRQEIRHSARALTRCVQMLLLAALLYQTIAARKTSTATLVIDLEAGIVLLNNRPVSLARREFDILGYLYERRDQLCRHEEIMKHAMQASRTDLVSERDRYSTAMSRLRQKIEPDPQQPVFLINVWGSGYRLEGVE